MAARDSIAAMKIVIVTFAVWLGAFVLVSARLDAAPQTQAKNVTISANTGQGRTLFHDRCALCHYDRSDAQKIGPGLKGIYARGRFADGKKVNDAAMIALVQNGGEDMPPAKAPLKPEEMRALIAYLRSL
jgi:cytochrome c